MKKITALALALLMLLSLAACSGPETPPDAPTEPDEPEAPETPETPEQPDPWEEHIYAPILSRDELPRLDGSTATAPLAVTMVSMMLGISEKEAEGLITFSRTTNSYYNLLYGSADLLLASEGNEEVYAAMESEGFEYEQTPFAIDAFVFVVNEANPVDSITLEQARGIYTGEITNWSELGGEDREIIPIQRNPEAGSQSLMKKLVMRDTEMMDPPKDYVAGSMGELMEVVRGYDSSPGAIGYSVYYYAEEMRAAEGLKLLAVDGVEPEPEAIRSGEYPLTNPYYVVIPARTPEDSAARLIRDWLLSDDGQKLIAREGYVSVMDLPTKPREIEPTIGTRLFDDYRGELTEGDYGLLIPYAGRRLTDTEMAETGCLYGLMTMTGAVVVDPVYSSVWASGDLLVLGGAVNGEQRYALAALDGSWCTDFEYLRAMGGSNGLVLFTPATVVLIGLDGDTEAVLNMDDLGIDQEGFNTMLLGPVEGGGGEWVSDKLSIFYEYDERSGASRIRYYDLTKRAVKTMDLEDWAELYPDYEYNEPPVEGAFWIYDSILGEDAPAILAKYEWEGEGSHDTFYHSDGSPIEELEQTTAIGSPNSIRLVGGLIEKLESNTATYYDMNTMRVVFRTYLGFEGD